MLLSVVMENNAPAEEGSTVNITDRERLERYARRAGRSVTFIVDPERTAWTPARRALAIKNKRAELAHAQTLRDVAQSNLTRVRASEDKTAARIEEQAWIRELVRAERLASRITAKLALMEQEAAVKAPQFQQRREVYDGKTGKTTVISGDNVAAPLDEAPLDL